MLWRKDHYDYTRSSSLQKYIVLQRAILHGNDIKRMYLNSNLFLSTERGDRKPRECKFNLNSFVQFFTFDSRWFFA